MCHSSFNGILLYGHTLMHMPQTAPLPMFLYVFICSEHFFASRISSLAFPGIYSFPVMACAGQASRQRVQSPHLLFIRSPVVSSGMFVRTVASLTAEPYFVISSAFLPIKPIPESAAPVLCGNIPRYSSFLSGVLWEAATGNAR